jgi:hypothetical protein
MIDVKEYLRSQLHRDIGIPLLYRKARLEVCLKVMKYINQTTKNNDPSRLFKRRSIDDAISHGPRLVSATIRPRVVMARQLGSVVRAGNEIGCERGPGPGDWYMLLAWPNKHAVMLRGV